MYLKGSTEFESRSVNVLHDYVGQFYFSFYGTK